MSRNVNNLKVTDNLFFLEGKDNNVIIGNINWFKPICLMGGKKKLHRVIETIRSTGIDSIDTETIDILSAAGILVEGDDRPHIPPEGGMCCEANYNEQVLALPLTSEENVYELSIDYQLGITKNNIVVKFDSSPFGKKWDQFLKIVAYLEDKIKQSPKLIHLKYYFETTAESISEDFFKWSENRDVILEVFFPLENGLVKSDEIEKLKKLNVFSSSGKVVKVITPVTKNNCNELYNIVEVYAQNCPLAIIELPAIKKHGHIWEYGNTLLPDVDIYTDQLLRLYNSRLFDDDQIYPINELRHRIVSGGYTPACSCFYDNVSAVLPNGNTYLCRCSSKVNRFKIGSCLDIPESSLCTANNEFSELQKDSLAKCRICKWRTLCGMCCPLSSLTNNTWSNVSKFYCEPRISLIKQMLWDIIKEAK